MENEIIQLNDINAYCKYCGFEVLHRKHPTKYV